MHSEILNRLPQAGRFATPAVKMRAVEMHAVEMHAIETPAIETPLLQSLRTRTQQQRDTARD